MNTDKIKMLNDIINIVMQYDVSKAQPPEEPAEQQEAAPPEVEAARDQLDDGA